MAVEEYFVDFTRRDWQTTTDVGPLRLAVIGIGEFARNRALPGIEKSDFCETTVVVSSSSDKALEVARRFDADHSLDYDDFLAGAATDGYDAAYVATPNALHLDYAEAAASFGKHVLCEKPIEATVERAERMIGACEAADVTLMVAYRLQVEPTVRRMRELLLDGYIGEPIQLHGGLSSRLLANRDPSVEWRLDPDLSGGGALIDVGVYPLNTSRFLFDADPTAVQATTSSRTAGFERVDEHVTFQLTFPDGTTASCTASFNAHPNSRLQVVGAEGQLLIESPFGGTVPHEITVERGEIRTEYTGPPVDEVVEEFDYFAHCALTGTEPEADGEDALTDLRVVEAAYESAETGASVAP